MVDLKFLNLYSCYAEALRSRTSGPRLLEIDNHDNAMSFVKVRIALGEGLDQEKLDAGLRDFALLEYDRVVVLEVQRGNIGVAAASNAEKAAKHFVQAAKEFYPELFRTKT